MIRFVADESLDGRLLEGLMRAWPDMDVLDVRACGRSQSPDPEVLAWAAALGRVVLAHDKETMVGFAYDRVRAGLGMPGLVIVREGFPIRLAIDEIVLLAECSFPDEYEGRVVFLPLDKDWRVAEGAIDAGASLVRCG
jgi:hypothetical protein